MKVYHGSDVWIEEIDLSKGRESLDFGRGFYVTNIRKHAHQRAIETAERSKSTPVVTEFNYIDVHPENEGLAYKQFHEASEEWLDFVLMNRDVSNNRPAHSYDIVEGPIADDWVTFQIRRYQQGKISKDALLEHLRYRKEKTHQICFCTIESLWALDPVHDDIRFDKEDIVSEITFALETGFSMNQEEAREKLFDSAVYAKLFEDKSKLYEQPWQEIYEMLKAELNI
jgi:hypothetical protein